MRNKIARLPWVRKVAHVVEGYFVIRASGVFDGHWYRQRYRSARWHPSPILHYLVRGAGEGCDPNPLFDTAWYAKVNRDVSATGLNPLVHYLKHGALEKRNPCRLFDTTWYLSQQEDPSAAASNPLGHYIAVGWKESRSPHEQFDACRYLEEHPDVREAGLNPLVHYRLYGEAEGRVVNPVRRGAKEPTPRARGGRGWKIVIISGEAQTPGHVYRAERLAQAFEQRGHEAVVMHAVDFECRVHEVDEAHALVIWRAGYSDQIASAISRAHSAGAKVVFDLDDLMIDPALAKTEVIDGIRSQGFTESGIADHYRAMQQTMLAADFCTCPTAELAAEMRRFQKAVFVVPNGFDEQCYEASRRAVARRRARGSDGLVRIGYAGGSLTHQRDFARAAPALARLLQERPECRLVLFRYECHSDNLPCLNLQEFPEFKGLESKIEWRPLVPLSELPTELARFDINIAPLETGNAFCEAKSALKYFEAALVDVPTVASPTGPFAEAIHDGQTGFLAESQQEWYTALKDLVTRPDVRLSVGQKACLDVLWRFGPERRAELVEEVYQQVIDGGSPAAARCFALALRRDREPRHPLPELSESELVFESGSPAQSPVAVVVPLYNYAQHVAEALDSVRAQTTAAKELVIVEDCSTDDSLQVALEWLGRNAQHFSRTALLRNCKNSGLALSRNAGFAFTDARFVLPLDPDNRIHPDFLQRCLAEIGAAGAAAAYATIQEFEFGSRKRSSESWKPQKLVGGNYIDAMALIRRSAWAAVGGYQRMKVMGWEDFDLWCRLAEEGLWAVWVPETLAEYRVHEKSMLATHTDLAGHRRILGEEMCALHPWLDRDSLTNARQVTALTAAEEPAGTCPPEARPQAVAHQTAAAAAPAGSARETPPAASNQPRPRGRERLEEILPLLRCPATGENLVLAPDNRLVTESHSWSWPVEAWRPDFSRSPEKPRRFPDSHLSNPVPPRGASLIEVAAGPVLNISAGGSARWAPQVIEIEMAIFRNTDIVGDAHALPFRDGVFDAVLALNAFEHYADPRRVVQEILRVLKPGGKVFIHAAFLQPLHEPPYHFFNCTKYGLLEWFKPFETVDICVSENFSPGYSIAWLAHELGLAVREHAGDQAAERLAHTPLSHVSGYWTNQKQRGDALWNDLLRLPQEAQEKTAAGFEYIGRKVLGPR